MRGVARRSALLLREVTGEQGAIEKGKTSSISSDSARFDERFLVGRTPLLQLHKTHPSIYFNTAEKRKHKTEENLDGKEKEKKKRRRRTHRRDERRGRERWSAREGNREKKTQSVDR